jgi:hypothetical protein
MIVSWPLTFRSNQNDADTSEYLKGWIPPYCEGDRNPYSGNGADRNLIQAMGLFATQDALGFCELAWSGSGVLAVGKSVASGLELLGTWFSAVDVFPVPPAAFGASPELALLASRLEISGCS